ncbi:metallophosphoesterase family protein [Alphaproteobacteria bacterium KMM 3653]|uniref:Metallophosphoesterase family protein n=1 Tax=Harenicola maris TaxID=2841044 RepID=A0AAP2G7M9_9RHOB|nr:metallophosphoesterase family protein [Harenicola maris]
MVERLRHEICRLADIHGNALALEAVLRDMEGLGLSEAVNLGDVFSGPLEAGRTAQMLMGRGFPSIRGNHDRYLIEHDPAEMGPSDRVAYDQLEAAHLEWIAGLPPTRLVFGDVFMCHGTPQSDSVYWLEKVEGDGRVRPATLAEIEAEAEGGSAGLILCAHTHIPRCLRLSDGRVVVNPGSIGCPAYDDGAPVYHVMQTGTPNASYAVVEKREGAYDVTFRSVPYAAQEASALAARNGRADWARSLATGWFGA